MIPTPIRYALVGVLNTFTDVLIFSIALWWLGWNPYLANTTGFVVSVVQSYLINRRWTFGNTSAAPPSITQFLYFVSVSGLGLLVSNVTIYLVSPFSGFLIAKLMAVIVVFLITYNINRLLIFSPSR